MIHNSYLIKVLNFVTYAPLMIQNLVTLSIYGSICVVVSNWRSTVSKRGERDTYKPNAVVLAQKNYTSIE